MKNLLFGILICFLVGCERQSLNAVRSHFSNDEVSNIPGYSYQYIVRKKDGTIYHVQNRGGKVEVYHMVLIFGPLKNEKTTEQ